MAEFIEVMKQRKRMCSGFPLCYERCPLYALQCKYGHDCANVTFNHADEAEAIIMKWASENPIKTNADKFKEVFGVEVTDKDACVISCSCSPAISCSECEFNNFWNKEYVEPKNE